MARVPGRRYTQDELDEVFSRADRQWDAGKLQSAFRLFLVGAKGGDANAQVNLGIFYDGGIGVKPHRLRALYWYRRAYRKGNSCAAHNLGNLYHHERKFNQALAWFERAVALGIGEDNLEIAKIHFQRGNTPEAVRYINKVVQTELWEAPRESKREARRMLKELAVAPGNYETNPPRRPPVKLPHSPAIRK